jgi:hypothetical protein
MANPQLIIEPGEVETTVVNKAEYATYFFMRIPTRLLPPRDTITQCMKITHHNPSPPDSALAHALRVLVEWAENHKDVPNPLLPSEMVDKSYLPAPILMEGTVNDILDQLMRMGVRVRSITMPLTVDFPAYHAAKELFKSKVTFESYGVSA